MCRTILAEGVLDDLNEEARAILQVTAETGLRVSEACNLSEATIQLNAEIPFVAIKKGKTSQAVRDVPLVGVALEALRRHPKGFPRYFDKADSLSATVNKFLESRKLLVEEGQSLYSLRHTFEDRLQEVEAPEKVITYLMGHQWHREKYGKGPKLEQKAKWMKKIAFASSKGGEGSSPREERVEEMATASRMASA